MRGRTTSAAFLNEFLQCTSIEAAWKLHTGKMAEFGFDRISYGASRLRTDGGFGDVTDALILSSHAPDYLDKFFGNEMYLHAPMAVWVTQNNGSISWQYAEDQRKLGRLNDAGERIMDINREMGVVAGYSIGFKEASLRSKSGIGLCARRGLMQTDVEEIWQTSGEEILMLNSLFNLKVLSLPYSGRRKPLTDRQREVLQWVADGKTTQDIATIMGLRPATIEKHLRLARDALNAETTAQAVLKASVQNQFFLFENVEQLREAKEKADSVSSHQNSGKTVPNNRYSRKR